MKLHSGPRIQRGWRLIILPIGMGVCFLALLTTCALR